MKTSRNLRQGGFSVLTITAAVVAAVIINLLAAALPASVTQIDITDQNIFTISDQTRQIVSGLEKDVDVYWLCTAGYEDANVEHLLDQYKELSDRIKITQVDPEVYPTFADAYMSDSSDLEDNSIVVECGERYIFMNYSTDMFDIDYSNYYVDGTYDYYFVGEDAVTAGIDYVVNDNLVNMYALKGHGENDLPVAYTSVIQRDNIAVEDLTLVLVGAIPEDCGILLINAPQVDITEAEYDMIRDFLSSGGSMMLVTQPLEGGAEFPYLEKIMNHYGVESVPGIIVEPDSYNYIESSPYKIVPDVIRHEITAPILDNSMYVLTPVAQGLLNTGSHPEGVTVERLLVSSNESFSKLKGYNMDTFSKEADDIDGPFLVACAITDEKAGGKLIWVSSGYITDYETNTKIAGNNMEFFTNGLNWMTGYEENIAMHSKNLTANYLSMTDQTARVLMVIVIAVIPLLYLLIGVFITVRRKRR